jgi:tetratricopeptide (TPR) repeat protein
MTDRAIDTFYQVIKNTTDSALLAQAYNNIGKTYYKKKEYRKALQSFTRALEETPSSEEIRMNRKAAEQAYENELALEK